MTNALSKQVTAAPSQASTMSRLKELTSRPTLFTFMVIGFPLLLYLFRKLRKFIIPFFLKLKNSNRNGGELVAKCLASHGVKFVFTLVGGHISPILVASKQLGIKVVDVRSEATTVFAADAVSRLSGVPGVAIVTAGPGVTNTITAMKNAQMAQSPLVLIGGAAATMAKGRGSLQDVEQLDVLRSIVKYNVSINSLRDIVPTMKRAFYEAQTGVPGPVFVEIPIDMLYCIGEIRASMKMGDALRMKALKQVDRPRVVVPSEYIEEHNVSETESKSMNVINRYLSTVDPDHTVFLSTKNPKVPWFIKLYTNIMTRYTFAGAFDTNWDYTPIPIESFAPSQDDCQKLLQLLKEAKKPCMIIGSQAVLDPRKGTDVRGAVEALGVPVYLSGMARGLMGREVDYDKDGNSSRSRLGANPKARFLHIRQNRRRALKESDFIILAGVVADFRLDYGRALSRKAKVVAINRSYHDLTLNADFAWKPHMKLQCDVADTLIQCADILKHRQNMKLAQQFEKLQKRTWNSWIDTLLSEAAAKEARNKAKSLQPAHARAVMGMKSKDLLNPLYLCNKLNDMMDDNSIIIVDGGDFAATAAYTMLPRGPLGWMDPGPFGTLGVGAGFALGAKLVCPETEIWLVWGDGSSGYSIAEIDTFCRFNLGIIAVIGNDACWTQIEREQVPKLGDNVACPLRYTAYHTVAQGFGGKADEIWTKQQLEGGVEENGQENVIVRAKTAAKEGIPFVINAHIGTSDFREGSISV